MTDRLLAAESAMATRAGDPLLLNATQNKHRLSDLGNTSDIPDTDCFPTQTRSDLDIHIRDLQRAATPPLWSSTLLTQIIRQRRSEIKMKLPGRPHPDAPLQLLGIEIGTDASREHATRTLTKQTEIQPHVVVDLRSIQVLAGSRPV